MVLKAAVVFIAGGLAGSGIVALTGSSLEPQPTAFAREKTFAYQEIVAPDSALTVPLQSSSQTDQTGYIQARFAVQRPFAALCPVTR
jgi:hypothetical protein